MRLKIINNPDMPEIELGNSYPSFGDYIVVNSETNELVNGISGIYFNCTINDLSPYVTLVVNNPIIDIEFDQYNKIMAPGRYMFGSVMPVLKQETVDKIRQIIAQDSTE